MPVDGSPPSGRRGGLCGNPSAKVLHEDPHPFGVGERLSALDPRAEHVASQAGAQLDGREGPGVDDLYLVAPLVLLRHQST